MKSHNSGSVSVVTITSTPTLIVSYTRELETDPRLECRLWNESQDTIIYLGYDSTVTTTTGWPLTPNEKDIETMYHGALYGVVDTGTANVRVRVK